MSLSEYFVPLLFPFCMESKPLPLYIPFRMVLFYLVTTSFILTSAYVRIQLTSVISIGEPA